MTACHATPSKYSSVAAVSVPTVAVPELSAKVKSTLVALGFDKLIVNTAKPPSVTVGLEMLTVGTVSLSLIVAVPVALALLVVLGAAFVTAKLNVSLGSAVLSLVVGVRTITDVEPGGILAVVASAQVAPPS